MLYADPFCDRRKAEMVATLGLKRAVMKNSRKWKSARAATKKGARQIVWWR